MNKNYVEDSVLGLAYGDAWGYKVEFQSDWEQLKAHPAKLSGELLISDDTQMSIYLMGAVYDLMQEGSHALEGLQFHTARRNHARRIIARAYSEYAIDPDNNRAPGMAVMGALTEYRALAREHRNDERLNGYEGCKLQSKGCGANMRVAWVGLLELDVESILNLAIIQSEVTHGHPLALASAAMTAYATHVVTNEERYRIKSLYKFMVDATYEFYRLTIEEGTGAVGSWNPDFSLGMIQLHEFLVAHERNVKKVMSLFYYGDLGEDLGGGWVAEEALLNAIVVYDKYDNHSYDGIQRLAHSTGDSDSIAAIGGALLGARYGTKKLRETSSWFEARYVGELATTVKLIEEMNEDLIARRGVEEE